MNNSECGIVPLIDNGKICKCRKCTALRRVRYKVLKEWFKKKLNICLQI